MTSTPQSHVSDQYLDAEIDRFLAILGADVHAIPSADETARTLATRVYGPPVIRWRRRPGRWLLHASRLAAAVAIVTLATGALLVAGVPSQAPPGQAPASDWTAGLVLSEEIEPGVVKVLRDDIGGHDLDGMPLAAVASGPDGTTWLLRATRVGGVQELIAIGGSETWEAGPLAGAYRVDLAASPDGRLWAVDHPVYNEGTRLGVFDGDAWTAESPPAAPREVEVAPDGTVWAAWAAPTGTDGSVGRPGAGYLGPDGWQSIGAGVSPATEVGLGWPFLAVRKDGEAWLGVGWSRNTLARLDDWRGLLRSDGSAWVVEHPIPGRGDLGAGPLAAGPDGTLWVYQSVHGYADTERFLSRLDDDGWTSYSAEDGVPLLVARPSHTAQLTVDAAGRLWIAIDTEDWVPGLPAELGRPADGSECPGVLSFDGVDWRQFLVGTCVAHLALAPDGGIWAAAVSGMVDESVLGADGSIQERAWKVLPEQAGLYLIRPDAAANASG